ncbi:MAG: hypothetical protein PVI26_01570 [Chitinispirillia bacterium]
MKKYICLLVLILLWGCNDIPTTSDNLSSETAYGSSVIKIAGLPRDSLSAGKVIYKFSLTITGSNMEPINISRQIDETGAIVNVKKIPAGRSRIFTGRLNGSNGESYEGEAYADIFGGKVTNVRLILRKTGGAQVEVIIEDMEDLKNFSGCYDIGGKIINGIDISDLTLRIKKVGGDNFLGYFKRDDKRVGKFWGTVINLKIKAEIYIKLPSHKSSSKIDTIKAKYIGGVAKDYSFFKGGIISYDDQSIGSIIGKKTNCKMTSLKFMGCYDIGGDIKGVTITDLTLDIFIPKNKERFGGYFKKDGKVVGKISGTFINGKLEAKTDILSSVNNTLPPDIRYEGEVFKDYNSFKGNFISHDGQHIGSMYGKRINCEGKTRVCITETLGGIGSTSCKDTTTWKKYAENRCRELGRVLRHYKFVSNCSKGDTDGILRFEGIIFSACLP